MTDTDDAQRIIDALTRPFSRDQMSKRKIGGRQVDYVEGHEYITRLNEASPAWSFRMTKSETTMLTTSRKGASVQLPCLTVYGELEIPGVGTRSGIGVQMIEDNAGEDVMKGAMTDCLKNAAKYFGLGLHMYSGDAPAPPQSRQDAPRATQAPAQVESPPDAEPVDYSDDKQWQAANRTLHATATNIIGKDDAHAALHIMAVTAGFPSVKNMPVKRLLTMNEFIQSDGFDAYYRQNLAPRLPQPKQEAMA